MKNEEYLNEALEKIIDEAAKLVAEDIGSEKLPDEDSVVLSEKHNQRMQQIFNAEREKLKRKRRMKITRIAACVVLVCAIGTAFLSAADVSAWKTRFLNFVQEFSQPNTDYNTKESGGIVYSDDNVILNYVPVGFELENSLSTKERVRLKFSGNEQYFSFILIGIEDNTNVDTENANAERLIINNYDAVFVASPNLNNLAWHNNECSLKVYGNISKEELIKIAENVKILKNK